MVTNQLRHDLPAYNTLPLNGFDKVAIISIPMVDVNLLRVKGKTHTIGHIVPVVTRIQQVCPNRFSYHVALAGACS